MQRAAFGLLFYRSADPVNKPVYNLPSPRDIGIDLCFAKAKDCTDNAIDRGMGNAAACLGVFLGCMLTGVGICTASGPASPLCLAIVGATCTGVNLACLENARRTAKIDFRNCNSDLRTCLGNYGIWEH